MQYLLQKSSNPSKWVVTDTENKIVITWDHGKFNDTQNVTTLEDFNPALFMELTRFLREIADWLVKNHPDKI
jgi:hypothetical protein